MAKGESKKTNQMIQGEQQRFGQQNDAFNGQLQTGLQGAQQYDNGLKDHAAGMFDDTYNSANNLQPYIDSLMNASKTGGFMKDISQESKDNIRGNGVFKEYEKTGGWSPDRMRDYRARATSTLPSMYANLKDEMGHGFAAQGGYNGGAYNAGLAKMARESFQGANDAAQGAESSIADSVDSGRKWGASSMSNAETGLQGLENQIGAGRNAYSLGSMNAGASLLGEQGRLRLGAAGGMGNLYGQAPGETGMYLNSLLANMGMGTKERQSLINSWMQNNPNVNWFDRYGKPLLSAGASVASAFA